MAHSAARHARPASRLVRAAVLLMGGLTLTACAGTGNYNQGYGARNLGTGTVMGATAGAVGGALLSRSLGGRDGRGGRTTFGAIAGGLVGGLAGNMMENGNQAPPQNYGGYPAQPSFGAHHHYPYQPGRYAAPQQQGQYYYREERWGQPPARHPVCNYQGCY